MAQLKEGDKRRISKAVVAGFVLGLLSVPFFFLYLIALIFCLAGLWRIKKSSGQLRGVRLALTGIFVPLLLWGPFFWFWFQDAGPVPNDYTIADLAAVRPENRESYDLLMKFWGDEEDNNILGLDEADCQVLAEFGCGFPEPNSIQASLDKIRQYSSEIQTLWDKSEEARRIFERLAEFDQITDLTEPEIEAHWPDLTNLRYLTALYQLHSMLNFKDGRHQEAMEDLLQVDRVFRKLSRYSRPLITKLGCYGILNRNIHYFNLLVNLQDTHQDELEHLRKFYLPYAEEEVSLNNNFLFEYLVFKHEIKGMASLSGWNPFFKTNSSNRVYKFHLDRLIMQDRGEKPAESMDYSVWPWSNSKLFPVIIDIEKDYLLPWHYIVYNPIGSTMILILVPVHNQIFLIKDRVIVEMNIFQALLQKRLGEEVDLAGVLVENNADLDVQKGIITIHGVAKEDVQMPIDPAVLGLAESR